MALGMLGANLITEITDDTLEARLCELNYDTCRDAVLEDRNWSFAIKRYKYSSPLKADPVFGFSYAYAIPSEVLRVIAVNDNNRQWVLEDRSILCDGSEIEVRAVIRVTDTSVFPPRFVKALAAYLASEIALPLTNSPAHQQQMGNIYAAQLVWASGNDGRQGRNTRRYSSEWIR